MTDIRLRRLPVGIQSFKEIREGNYLYVDKSDIVWNMVNLGEKYNYLSRPRRFGKSVLVDTLESYLEGRKDLFEGLKIMQLEKDWKQYPVIRLDMSRGGANEDTLRSYLNLRFKDYEEKYNGETIRRKSRPVESAASLPFSMKSETKKLPKPK